MDDFDIMKGEMEREKQQDYIEQLGQQNTRMLEFVSSNNSIIEKQNELIDRYSSLSDRLIRNTAVSVFLNLVLLLALIIFISK